MSSIRRAAALVCLLLLASGAIAASFEETPAAELPAGLLQTPPLSAAQLEMYRRLSPENQRLFAKAASLGVLSKPGGLPYTYLYKRGGKFFLEACALVPSSWQAALPAARDFRDYGRWAFRNINARRNGAPGKYFVDLESLSYSERDRLLRVSAKLNILWKGRHGVSLSIEDHLSDPSPAWLRLKLARPSRLASSAEGDFRAYPLPGEQAFLLYFVGQARLHWTFYYVVPLSLIRGEVIERTATLLENIRGRLGEGQALPLRPSSSSSR